ncbi:unnamed protein product [Euphydryas editha]|uniref:Uncharacterized protein n=1 Tax=Euphydryas editha TaxID=104508 RepID=A0AAU9VE91_EUPED|nr:unnamed protein product [Euphydryas editha]
MSTEGSDSVTSSQIRRFGLYRTIDAKTEEFLRLSRKRQMRQGCACAAISTTITVTIVIIVLLIYEYMIAVETSFVQERKGLNKSRYIKKDFPIADRLDRNYFGFDQDYYERMPLLINALQEVSHTEPETRIRTPRKKLFSKNSAVNARTTTPVNKFIRRTSPRPFIIEYKSPYPMPFAKANEKPKNWFEEYRNAQRLKNLHDVIKYLEKTLNAKFGDIYLPSSSQITFSEMYLGSLENKNDDIKLRQEFRTPKYEAKLSHQSDPLYFYKPNSPGEINLLADGLRFAPTFHTRLNNEQNREIKQSEILKPSCIGTDCFLNKKIFKIDKFANSEEVTSTISPKLNKPNHVYWIPVNKDQNSENTYHKYNSDKIYITTSKPVFQFRKKSTMPGKRFSYRIRQRPRLLKGRYSNKYISSTYNDEYATIQNYNTYNTIKNYDNEVPVSHNNNFDITTTGSNVNPTLGNIQTVSYPQLNYSNIEDYHLGSSGVIPIEYRQPAIYPIVTPIVPLTNIFTPVETTTTNPPEIIKFSREDAKIPNHYYNIRKSDLEEVTQSDINYPESTEVIGDKNEPNTLVVKLKNMVESTSRGTDVEESTTDDAESENEGDAYTTISTYVPQINGHYRHVKSKTLKILLQENSEKYRKKRIESLTTRNPTYVPMYVEISRNRNNTVSDQN